MNISPIKKFMGHGLIISYLYKTRTIKKGMDPKQNPFLYSWERVFVLIKSNLGYEPWPGTGPPANYIYYSIKI